VIAVLSAQSTDSITTANLLIALNLYFYSKVYLGVSRFYLVVKSTSTEVLVENKRLGYPLAPFSRLKL
jgi:hypothetical protein